MQRIVATTVVAAAEVELVGHVQVDQVQEDFVRLIVRYFVRVILGQMPDIVKSSVMTDRKAQPDLM